MTALSPGVLAWLAAELPGRRITGASPLAGGLSNETLLLADDAGGRWVLRRLLRSGALPDVEMALSRLVDKAPNILAYAELDAGGPLLLVEYARGRVLSEVLPGLDRDAAYAVGVSTGVALAEVGRVEFDRPGFFADGSLRVAPMDGSYGLVEFVERCLAESGLTLDEQSVILDSAKRGAPLVEAAAGQAHLVHADWNPKNLIASPAPDGGWAVTAVLDWEFAFSGSPLVDLGNLLRFGEDHPAGFEEGVLAGVGELPAGWRETARALDMYALADFLTRPPGTPFRDRAQRILLRT